MYECDGKTISRLRRGTIREVDNGKGDSASSITGVFVTFLDG